MSGTHCDTSNIYTFIKSEWTPSQVKYNTWYVVKHIKQQKYVIVENAQTSFWLSNGPLQRMFQLIGELIQSAENDPLSLENFPLQ